MHRNQLLTLLETYKITEPIDEVLKRHLFDFVKIYPNCFARDCLSGHVTGSAVVINPEKNHKKLGFWMQFGGHSDNGSDTLKVAKRELVEESGIKEANLFLNNIFDIDIHSYPQKGDEPEHLHYDVRFLFETPLDTVINRQEAEVNEIKWVALPEALKLDGFYGHRLIRKIEILKP